MAIDYQVNRLKTSRPKQIDAISQTTFSNAFYFYENIPIKISLNFIPNGPIQQNFSIGSDNGLAPSR